MPTRKKNDRKNLPLEERDASPIQKAGPKKLSIPIRKKKDITPVTGLAIAGKKKKPK